MTMLNRDSVSVIVGTFGDRSIWAPLACRAVASAAKQTVSPSEIIWLHEDSLSAARNRAAEIAKGPWLIFLDADDELEPTYIEEMLKWSGADLVYPAVRVLMDSPDEARQLPDPILLDPKPGGLIQGNHIVVGAMIRRDLFRSVGGFKDWPVCEDWCLWLECSMLARATIVPSPAAVYRQHWRPGSRNQMERRKYAAVCEQIREYVRMRASL